MSGHDEVPGILEPYSSQFQIWEREGKVYKQHELVPSVGMATTYAVWLDAPLGTSVRYLTVQENRITNLMAHQPVPEASVFDKWGKYLGRAGGPLEEPGRPAEKAVSMIELAMREAPDTAIDEETQEPTASLLGPPPMPEEVECHLHRFWLREGLEVSVTLPLDLTDEEAERFAVFVTTLPLSAKTQG